MSNSSRRVSRRLLAVAPVAVIAALALSSCSANEAPSDQPPGVGTLPTTFTPSPAPTASVHGTQDQGVVAQSPLTASLKNTSGAIVGNAQFTGGGTGTTVTVDVNGLAPGFHSLSVTEEGVCETSDGFASAGDVLNDATNADESLPKTGDLATLLVDGNGNAQLTTNSGGIEIDSLTKGPGTALVIGSDADGASRVACGVIQSQ